MTWKTMSALLLTASIAAPMPLHAQIVGNGFGANGDRELSTVDRIGDGAGEAFGDATAEVGGGERFGDAKAEIGEGEAFGDAEAEIGIADDGQQ